jgi:hypothetical protein
MQNDIKRNEFLEVCFHCFLLKKNAKNDKNWVSFVFLFEIVELEYQRGFFKCEKEKIMPKNTAMAYFSFFGI